MYQRNDNVTYDTKCQPFTKGRTPRARKSMVAVAVGVVNTSIIEVSYGLLDPEGRLPIGGICEPLELGKSYPSTI